jgi:uncharacterized protein (TIGR02145 family)
MKHSVLFTLILLLICATGLQAYSQDIIVLKNGDEIQAIVSVVGIDAVTYKKWDNLNGPDYTQPKSEIFMIKYANGTKDVFTEQNPKPAENNVGILANPSYASGNNIYGTITDSRDGKTYKTVTLGIQTWLAENLNYETPGSWCIDCEIYGRNYTYEAAKKSCPTGWHLPSETEWTTLTDFAGGGSVVGGNLKESGTIHWKSPNTGATNSSGFTALPHGFRTLFGYLSEPTKFAMFWTSTESMFANIKSVRLDYNKSTVSVVDSDRNIGNSLRCVKD